MSQEQITQETVPVAETTETPTEAPKQETQIEQPVPTVAKSWKEAIPEELRNDPNIAKFTELESLAKSYVNATRMIGQDKVAVPNNNSTEDQWNEVYDKLGRPESADKYQLDVKSDAVPLDESAIKSFAENAHQLGLNNKQAQETQLDYGAQWVYKPTNDIQRGVNEVLVESELKEALIRLNPDIAAKTELADEVIYKLRAVLIAVNQVGLVKANEEFFKWMTGEKTMPFGENNRHVPVRLIDFKDLSNNTYVVTNQYRIHHRETKIPDIVMMINGIPVVVGEAKTPIRPSVSWLDGAHEVHDIYENAVPQLFVPNILSFATEGKELYYGAVRCPLEFWAPWRLENDEDAIAKQLGLSEIGRELSDLVSPVRLLDIMRNFSLFTTDKKKRRIKIEQM